MQQAIIIQKFKEYLEAKGDLAPEDITYGLCAGLVAYFLYYNALGKQDKFIEKLIKASAFNTKDFKTKVSTFGATEPKIDLEIHEFLDNILGLHNIAKVVPEATQTDMHVSINTLINEDLPKVAEPEFQLSFLFNQESLEDTLTSIVHDKKMIRISNGLHVVGLMRIGTTYMYYDPEASYGPKEITSIKALAEAIFKSISNIIEQRDKTKLSQRDYLPVNFSIYDLEQNTTGVYFDPLGFYKTSLQKPEIKKALNNRYFLLLLSKFNEYALMDLLFTQNYKLQPWTISETPELIDAVEHNNQAKVAYLLQHNLPVDKNASLPGYSALSHAIINNNSQIVYALLQYGANPNLSINNTASYSTLAIQHKAWQSLVLLLASGMNFGAKDLEALKANCNLNTVDTLAKHALALHAKLLEITQPIDLDTAIGSELCKLAQHVKLQLQLGLQHQPLADIVVTSSTSTSSPSTSFILDFLLKTYREESFTKRISAIDHQQLYDALSVLQPGLEKISMAQKHVISQYLQNFLDRVELSAQTTQAIPQKDALEIQILLEYTSQLMYDQEVEEDQVTETLKSNSDQLYKHKGKTIQHQFKSVFANASTIYAAKPSIAEADLMQSLRLTQE